MHQAREQAKGNAVKGPIEGKKAIPMLDRQSPLPKTTLVGIINQNEERFNMERAIAPLLPYANNQMFVPNDNILDPWRENLYSELLRWTI